MNKKRKNYAMSMKDHKTFMYQEWKCRIKTLKTDECLILDLNSCSFHTQEYMLSTAFKILHATLTFLIHECFMIFHRHSIIFPILIHVARFLFIFFNKTFILELISKAGFYILNTSFVDFQMRIEFFEEVIVNPRKLCKFF